MDKYCPWEFVIVNYRKLYDFMKGDERYWKK